MSKRKKTPSKFKALSSGTEDRCELCGILESECDIFEYGNNITLYAPANKMLCPDCIPPDSPASDNEDKCTRCGKLRSESTKEFAWSYDYEKICWDCFTPDDFASESGSDSDSVESTPKKPKKVKKTDEKEKVKEVKLKPYVVHVSSIDSVQFHIKCPFCWTKYKKDGEPHGKAKNKMHHYGSEGSRANRTIHRTPTCDPGRFPRDEYTGFDCVVDDDTEKK
jgi:hypothetical protein